MDPSVCFTSADTPEDLAAAWPPLPAHALACGYVHADGAAVPRYLVKLSVVPESSWRCTVWMVVLGSEAVGLSALIAGSFHLVMSELKIFASVVASSTRPSTPGRLYPTAIGPPTMGMLMPWPLVQTDWESVTSEPVIGESEPAKASVPWLKSMTPSPEDDAL